MTKKGKKQYTYDYPEQRMLSKGLKPEDKATIAKKSKYSIEMIYKMCSGDRKMTDFVERLVKQLILINQKAEDYKQSVVV